MRVYFKQVVLMIIGIISSLAAFNQHKHIIRPGETWPDTDGNHIQAHGGGIIKLGNTWYWYGEQRRKGLDTNFRYVSCYSSRDLVKWKFHGDVLKLADPENVGHRWVLERPKVFYNRKTRKYVMYFHLDDRTYRLARVGVAVSDKPDGNYTYVKSFRPLGFESRDIGQFIDDDGSAYLIFESRPSKGFYIAALSEDYMDVVKQVSFIHSPLEGGAVVHYKGLYYAIGSALTGWQPNPNKVATATSLEGPWSAFKDIAPPQSNTWGSQSTMLLKVAGKKDTTIIFMGDQWRPGTQWDSRYLWMPVEIGDGKLSVPEPRPWTIDVKTGEYKIVQQQTAQRPYQAYLFAYFTGNRKNEEAIRFALSRDGYRFHALNNNNPVIASEKITSTGGVRDPHILRGADGKTFYMVATDMVSVNGWNSNRAMVLLKSTDLVNWTSSVVNIQKTFPGQDSLLRVWAPQTIYDDSAKKYMVYFSMKHGKDPDKIYYAYANNDFTGFEEAPKQLFFNPENAACIDGDIVKKDDSYYLFFKTEDSHPGIKIAVSKHLTGGYAMFSSNYVQQTERPVEGAGTYPLNDGSGYILMYDMYTSGRYQFTKTTDLKQFSIVDEAVSMNFHPRHGTVMPITAEEADRLLKQWPSRDVHNPALKGLYADPDILYSEKTGKFYIYPTSDGFTGWSGTYFKTFSSSDLINWKDEGVILDLAKDVSWAKKNAWAPAILEKKIDGQYKYFYYFCAEQKIGVAVADNPTGPFIDIGKPLIDTKPGRGQNIDPDVFTDPKSGKTFLYWGNGFMAGAELNEDLVSLKPETITLLTPDTTFREGTHVFYRNGIYYFSWSENDTRDPDYRVRYGTSDGPLGKISVPQNNIVIAKDAEAGIYATGHHSTIQMPGKDEWYIVYHRFSYPDGINMGRAAGYNREVCIDKMEFNTDGTIKPVKPTHEGIKP